MTATPCDAAPMIDTPRLVCLTTTEDIALISMFFYRAGGALDAVRLDAMAVVHGGPWS